MVVVVSHLFLFLGDKFRGRCDSHESHLPLCGTIYFPTAPFCREISYNFCLKDRKKGFHRGLIFYRAGMIFVKEFFRAGLK